MYSHFFLQFLKEIKVPTPTVFYNQIFNHCFAALYMLVISNIFIFKFKVKDNWSTRSLSLFQNKNPLQLLIFFHEGFKNFTQF